MVKIFLLPTSIMDATRHERIMETPQKAIEFVNAPVRHRTAQIAPKKWEKHRLRITELYLASKNVAEVMKRMQSECGFYAKYGFSKSRLCGCSS